MQLNVLGSSGTAPAIDNPASGYLVETDKVTIWVDCGPGTYMALLEHVEPGAIDAVVISHMHPDHCTDVFALYHALKFVAGVTRPVPVFAPEGSMQRFAGFLQAGPEHSFFQSMAVRETRNGESAAVGDLQIFFAAARHSVPALGVRLETRHGAIGYTGDTGPSQALDTHFSGVDVLIAEASLPPGDDYPFHMSPVQAAEMATAARVDRLVLTHLRETQDPDESIRQAAGVFGGDVGLARPGDVYKIGPGDREGI